VDYFATRFALRAGPMVESDLFDIGTACKEEICFRNICRESDYAHTSKRDRISKKWFRRDDPKLQMQDRSIKMLSLDSGIKRSPKVCRKT
jgi:hypothetical protein